MSKIFKPFILLIRLIYKIIDKLIVTPVSRLIYKISEFSKENSNKIKKILNTKHSENLRLYKKTKPKNNRNKRVKIPNLKDQKMSLG